mgnify:CR=1 FL=1
MIDNTENSQRKNKIEDTEQSACTLCPRDCKKNRADGEIGVCGETAAMRIGRAALHVGGTVYFRRERLRGGFFHRVSASLRVLPELRNLGWRHRQADHSGSACADIS